MRQAAETVPVGAQYRHFKPEHKVYEVVGHYVDEESREPAVLYRQVDYPQVKTGRLLSRFVSTVLVDGEETPRFTLLEPTADQLSRD
ncbi:DUF1653 domain-containing protein [Candidatus Saccharibacteria bacterium]|nr:DUF1653 domain-containing protein [Candidatus Saccharibacteria bacterium]